jgi:hypothetical protein
LTLREVINKAVMVCGARDWIPCPSLSEGVLYCYSVGVYATFCEGVGLPPRDLFL